ncbi:response regulator [Kineosporia succinea]|uniref:DNA-binding NarL/FixJ family response regulator n=1 Tax=Kineosporia succinea TaxID=84632 RepID=A0ABT9P2G6_9ACTN|nr:response regulator transcription factor [Kineosporia succinea]MDP9826604.1 DNA-binding NarL/FixJ family response regulator [Kineosporia succinea]
MTVLVADDNPVIRIGLRQLLTAEPATRLVGEARDGAEALRRARELRPDVVLLDVRMPGTSGLDVLPELATFTCVLMLTSSEEDETVRRAVRDGARGYLVYGTFDESTVVQNILAAAGGGSVFSASAVRVLASERSAAAPAVRAADPAVAALLSDREAGVMELLAAGRTNGEIAQLLFVAPKTVKNHVNRIFAKLGARSRREAVEIWARAGPAGPSSGPAPRH